MRFVGWTEEGYCEWSIGLYGWDKREIRAISSERRRLSFEHRNDEIIEKYYKLLKYVITGNKNDSKE